MKSIPLLTLAILVAFAHQSSARSRRPAAIYLPNDNNASACDLYRQLSSEKGNLFFSPHSISTALAMTYAGAHGNTAEEMADVLHFTLPQDKLHRAFSDLDKKLTAAQKDERIEIHVANSLWPHKTYRFRDGFMKTMGDSYGVEITPVDYAAATEKAREMINDWAAENTKDKIQDLIPPGILSELTRLVLANAIYFKGEWAARFNKADTQDAPFTLADGKKVIVPLMCQTETFGYWEQRDMQILELPYGEGGLSMIVLLPRAVAGLPAIEKELTWEKLAAWTKGLHRREVRIFLPRFKIEAQFSLSKTLQTMGMKDAFNPREADFSLMDPANDLFISAVLHKAFVAVDEKGTEAAAATAVVMTLRGMPAPPPVFRADHPFLFAIRDNNTGSILFIGRVLKP